MSEAEAPDPGEALTIPQAADLLKISRRMVEYHIEEGDLFAFDVGRGEKYRQLRIWRHELDRWADGRKAGQR